MSSAGIAVPPAAPAESPKKRAKKTKKTGPTVSDLILKSVAASTECGGVTLPALKKALMARGYDVAKNNRRVLAAIRRLLAGESLLQAKGTGASGSFKLNRKPPARRKKAAAAVKEKKKKKKKQRAAKVKRAGAKGATGGDAPAAKASPQKKGKAESPKKAKRPAATKKAKSPKGAKQRVARSTRTRSAANK